MQNFAESVHDDRAMRLHALGNASGMPWIVRGIMRCCGITWICVLCFLGLLLLLVLIFACGGLVCTAGGM
jgi:hypothetical protein